MLGLVISCLIKLSDVADRLKAIEQVIAATQAAEAKLK